jgi:hypothetical protein
MRNAGFRTVGARNEVGNRDLVVIGTAHVAFGTACSSLGDRHGALLLQFSPVGQLEERQKAGVGYGTFKTLGRIRSRTDTFTCLGAQGKDG